MPLMSESSFVLNGAALRRLDYHWFWGLWYNANATAPTMFSQAVERLLGDEALRAQIKDSQEALHRYSPLVQFFYWLFNIDNYTYHAYVRAAAVAHQQQVSHEENITPIDANYAWARQRIIDVLSSAQHLVAAAFTNTADTPKPLPAARATNNPSLTSRQDNNQTILVTEHMLPHLAELGIVQEVGAELSFRDFKLACRRQLLATHPDKGGTAEKFCSMNAAIDALTRLISALGTALLSDALAALTLQLDQLKVDMAEALAAITADWAADMAAITAQREADRAEDAAHFARLYELIRVRAAAASQSNAAALSAQGVFPSTDARAEGVPSSSDPRLQAPDDPGLHL